MSLVTAALFALAAQAQPLPGDPLARPEAIERPRRENSEIASITGASGPSARLRRCLDLTQSNVEAASLEAREWLISSQGHARAEAGHCLGLALITQARWDEALETFTAALGNADPAKHQHNALLGGLAGNTALGLGENERAMELLGIARGEALAAGDADLGFALALDQAQAALELNDLVVAKALAADVRERDPNNVRAWTFSATIERSTDDPATAFAFIQRAERLAPQDHEVMLEAGLVAIDMDEAERARGYFDAIRTAAPGSVFAQFAGEYLAELDATQIADPAADSTMPSSR